MSTSTFTPGRPYLPTRLTPGAATLVAVVDRIMKADIPTLATGMDDTGIIFLLLGKAYEDANDAMRSHMLEHEASHLALRHLTRFKALAEPRQPQIWNLAADAAIHHQCLDPTPFEEAALDPVTFAKLDLPPCTAETAYAFLLKKAKDQLSKGGQGCGHGTFKIVVKIGQPGGGQGEPGEGKGEGPGEGLEKVLGDLPDWVKSEIADAVEKASRAMAGRQAGTQRGTRGALGPVQDPPPAWMAALIAYLQRKSGRRIRKRSWMRENNRNEFLPGRARMSDKTACIYVDCSGSIPDTLLAQVCGLMSQIKYKLNVVLWAVDTTERLTTGQALKLLKDGTGPGGGTDPMAASQHRLPGERAIWITDGEVCRWPHMTEDDIVLTTHAKAPAPAVNIEITI